MAVTQAYSLNAVTIGTTEYGIVNGATGLGASTTAGVFQLFVDLNNLAAGDSFTVRYYEKCLSGGTQRIVVEETFNDAQPSNNKLWAGPALMLLHGWEMSIVKAAGTDRAITASIRKSA